MEQSTLSREFLIAPDLCDQRGQLTVLGALTLFQSLASEHAEQIGVGFAAMAQRREFWLTVHCQVELLRPVPLLSVLTGETWPERCRPEDIRCFRSYRLKLGEEVVAVGRTQWAILGDAGKVVPFGASCFPQDFPFPESSAIPGRPARFVDDLPDEGLSYCVRSTDIDVGHHMNNVAYVRALLGCLQSEELTRVRSFEIHYGAPCLEGDVLTLCRRDEADGVRLTAKKAGGKAAVQARLTFRP